MLLALAVTTASAQERIPCDRRLLTAGIRSVPAGTRGTSTTKGRVRIPVILAAFPDQAFSRPDSEIRAYWDTILNESGFHDYGAAGCVADYFKKQSGGQFEPVFDVIGPVMLPDSVATYGKNRGGRKSDDINGGGMAYDACVATGLDFAPYSWSGDKIVDVVMVVFAGPGENRGGMWRELGGMELTDYACVSELRNSTDLDGFGTFVHEFSHCLNLPDLYPISNSEVYSFFDEWDLMDGGNYANNGFSPPNYSALERWICGWYDFTELTESTTITNMPIWDDEPVAYVIRNSMFPDEYYILENHNRTYRQSEAFFGKENHYTADGHSNYLSLSAFPYVVGDSINNYFTKTSVPAMSFSKPITNISMDADGHISFDFMKEETAIRQVKSSEAVTDVWYDLQGRRLLSRPSRAGLYIHNGKKESIR